MLSIASAALLVLLIGGLVLSGWLWRDLNAPAPTFSQSELNSLERRDLHFATVARGAPCPLDPIILQDPGLAIGFGPVYLVSSDVPAVSEWGGWADYEFVYSATVPGLVLIRAKDLQTGKPVAFVQFPLGPSGITATGRVLGTDHLLNRRVSMRSEAVFQDPAHMTPMGAQGKLPPLDVMVGLQRGASGCLGLQIDGPNFTQNLVILLTGSGL
jgi:hypothetical protein